MKQTQKKILGYLGLIVVAVMTCAAILIPDAGVSAASTVTDTLEVRVVGAAPSVDIIGINEGSVYINPERPFVVEYENAARLTLTLKYTDLDGNTTTELLDDTAVESAVGDIGYELNFVE